MFTDSKLLSYLRIKISQKPGERFVHTEIERLPQLSYRFMHEGNWSATDLRFTAKQDEAVQWIKDFWSTRLPNSYMTNGELFEQEFETAVAPLVSQIINHHQTLVEKWNKILEDDFEKKFDDKLLNFLDGKD